MIIVYIVGKNTRILTSEWTKVHFWSIKRIFISSQDFAVIMIVAAIMVLLT